MTVSAVPAQALEYGISPWLVCANEKESNQLVEKDTMLLSPVQRCRRDCGRGRDLLGGIEPRISADVQRGFIAGVAREGHADEDQDGDRDGRTAERG